MTTSNKKITKLLEDYTPQSKWWRSEIKADELKCDKGKILGSGNYGYYYFKITPMTWLGKVYLGYLHGTPCAVKYLDVKGDKEFILTEIGLMRLKFIFISNPIPLQ